MPSSGGIALTGLGQFVLETGKHTLDPGKVLMEAVNQTYLFGEMMKGKDTSVTVQSGAYLSHVSQLSGDSQFGFYNPNDTFSYSIENLDVEQTYRWRFAHSSWTYTDHEQELNKQGSQFEQIYDVIFGKRAGCETGILNGIEAALWTTPSNTTMEASNGTRPYSIRTWITEDGLAPAGFTTVGGVNPTTYSRWRNQVSTYTAANIDSELIPAFDDQVRKVAFEVPDSYQKYLEETKFNKFKILTDINGDKKYAALTRNANDRLVGDQRDLGYVNQGANVFRGIPVKYVKEMDNIAYAATQPRYFWVNTDHLYPVVHGKRWMYELAPMNSVGQPYTWVVHKDSWYQIVCTSRQRQGIIAPV